MGPVIFGKSMRHLLFLFSILLVVACGCGKKPAGQTTSGSSNPPPEQASNPAAPEPSYEQDPETNTTIAIVDMIIQNNTTNRLSIDIMCASGLLGMEDVNPGQNVTNNVTWLYWPDMYFSIFNSDADFTAPSVVVLKKANKNIPLQKHATLRFNIPNPYIVNVDDDNIKVRDLISSENSGTN